MSPIRPDELLLASARRLHYCRQNGPAHEISWALNLIDTAICGLGYADDHRQELPKLPANVMPGEPPDEYAAQLWPAGSEATEKPGTCHRCGLCCRLLIVEATDLDVLRQPRIAAQCEELVGLDGPEWSVACGKGRPCPFLVRHSAPGVETTCLIYPTRPNACVAFEPGGEKCREIHALAAEGLKPGEPVEAAEAPAAATAGEAQ